MRRLGVGLAAALVAVLVAGCGGSNPKPSPVSQAPSASASASPSLSESASPSGAPTMPAEARGTTPESAEAFVRYYIDVLNYAGRTGEIGELRSTSSADCACSGVGEYIHKIYAAGGHIEGSGWHLRSMTSQASPKGMVVRAIVDVGPQAVVTSSGGTPQHFDGGDGLRKVFSLQRQAGSWSVVKIGQPDG